MHAMNEPCTAQTPAQSTLFGTARLSGYNLLKMDPLIKFWYYWKRMEVAKSDFKKMIRSAQRLLFEGGHPSKY